MSEQSEALRLADVFQRSADFLDAGRLTGTARTHPLAGTSDYSKAAVELRRQHSRIEADEALMRQALEAMQVNATWPFPKKREEAITALRTRLEEAK